MLGLLWLVAIVVLAFWVFGLVLDLIGAFIWIALVVGAVLLLLALFRTIAGGRGAP